MLVVTRREDESILIGDRITVVVLRVDRGHVSVGISAPPEVLVLRSELSQSSRTSSLSEGIQK